MRQAKFIAIVVLLGLIGGRPMRAIGESTQKESRGDISFAELFGKKGTNNPVRMLLQAYEFEEEGKLEEALQIYHTIQKQWPSSNRWGRKARLRITKCLLCAIPAQQERAKKVLEEIPLAKEEVELHREYSIWNWIIELHRKSALWLKNANQDVSDLVPQNIQELHIPKKLLQDIRLALSGISHSFISANSPSKGSAFLHKVLSCTSSKKLQRVLLRELITMQLKAEQGALALVTARAYWLTSVEKSHLLPDAIERMTDCLRVMGASKSEIDQYQTFQRYGPEGGKEKNQAPWNLLDKYLNQSTTAAPLFAADIIEKEKSILNKARLYLFNGDLHNALPLLRQALKKYKNDREKTENTFQLIRMSFALFDGHVHNVDRFERYIHSRSDIHKPNAGEGFPSSKSPFEEMIERAGLQ